MLGRLWFELGGVWAFILLAPRSDFALDRFQLLTYGPEWKASLKRAARFVFACRFGSLRSLFARHHGPSWNPIIFDFARHRGCRRSGPDRCMSARQHDNESGSCDRVGNDNDDAGSPQPALLTLAIQQSVVGCSLLRTAKDFNGSCDLAEPTRGIRIARVEVRMVRLRGFAIRLDQGFIVRIRTNTEQIVMCSHLVRRRPAKNDAAENAPISYHAHALRPKRFRLGYCFRPPVFAIAMDSRRPGDNVGVDPYGRPLTRRTQGTSTVRDNVVHKPGDHKGGPYSRQCWMTTLVRGPPTL